jgi:DNA-directed RNA polymerase subunit M/transcription elongation factor TFIIS
MSDNGDTHPISDGDQPIDASDFECPNCGQILHAERGEVARLLQCPACSELFVIPALDGSTDLPDAAVATEEQKAHSELQELNSLRMRHLIVTRRTAIRTRTYYVAGAVSCLVGAIQLAIMTVTEVRIVGWHLRQVSFVLFAIAALYLAAYLFKGAAHWGRQSQAAKIPDPETPPDFTPLSDGSQHAKNLEHLE